MTGNELLVELGLSEWGNCDECMRDYCAECKFANDSDGEDIYDRTCRELKLNNVDFALEDKRSRK